MSARLLRQVEPYRHETVLLDGDPIPKSAALLVSMLEREADSDSRYEIYGHIVLECQLTGRTAAAVKFARARYEEFRDVTSMIAYSAALIDNGEIAAGLGRAREALEAAIKSQTLVNYAAGNLVRESIKTGRADTVNEAIDTLIESTRLPRGADCALETDWADAAEALGADRQRISRVRSAAARRDDRSGQR